MRRRAEIWLKRWAEPTGRPVIITCVAEVPSTSVLGQCDVMVLADSVSAPEKLTEAQVIAQEVSGVPVVMLCAPPLDMGGVLEVNAGIQTVLDACPLPLFLTSADGSVLYCNEALMTLAGWAPETIVEKGFLNFHFIEGDGADGSYLPSTTGPTTNGVKRATLVLPDGASRTVSVTSIAIPGPEGVPMGMVGIVEDHTELHVPDNVLTHGNKIEALGRLSGGVAHDLNNLLQAMLSVTQALAIEHSNPFAFSQCLSELEQYIRRGAQVVRQVLLFSRHDKPHYERLDLNEIVAGAARLLQWLLRENIAVTLCLAEGPIEVRVERTQLEFVLINLALNAQDAMPMGGNLGFSTALTDSGEALITVSDSGPGISPDIKDLIFEPFFTTKPRGCGTGLGLAIARRILNDHSGSIGLESNDKPGTTFRMVLPRVSGLSDDRRGENISLAPLSSLSMVKGQRVILIEDEASARGALKQLLIALGLEVVAVGSAEEFCALPEKRGFDLLLTDILLPGLRGDVLAGQLLKTWPLLKVILMSGYSPGEEISLAHSSFRFLQKPFDIDDLAREIRAVLDPRADKGGKVP